MSVKILSIPIDVSFSGRNEADEDKYKALLNKFTALEEKVNQLEEYNR